MDISLDKHKNIIVNLLLVALAIFLAVKIYKGQDEKVNGLREARSTELNKNTLLSEISGLEKKINSFKKFLNQKDSSDALNKISSIAGAQGVKITSIRPQPEISYNIYSKLPFKLSLEAKNYHQLGRFISALESSPYIYSVESMVITPAEKGQGVELTVSTYFYKK